MKSFLLFIAILISVAVHAQDVIKTDTLVQGTLTVNKDPRLDVLAKNEASFNATASRSAKGYRLMVLNTNNRNLAMSLRSKLLQRYPDQKVYMSFQPPYIKLKFGDFTDEETANKFKDELLKSKLIPGNIYVVPEIIDLPPANQ
ncbi:MAG TPA: SPOR domain-containing protein [Ferruginibacter sp.]|nr:SPOR domain-containing protein [Ferruginibacter sp.]